MNEEVINEIIKKKEFSKLPRGIIERVLELKEVRNLDEKEKIKKAREILRKAFTAFLTNKILKGKIKDELILKSHYSTKNRDYKEIYYKILGKEKSIIDLGAGINGFGYNFLDGRRYVAIEAVGQLVELMNEFFSDKNAVAIHEDLFNLEKIKKIIENEEKPRVVFLFNIIDGLELIERNFSKKLIQEVAKLAEKVVLSFPVASLSRRTRFKARRYWLLGFLENNFEILQDFELDGERFIVFRLS